ncbi:tRNA (adenine(22)-N(1))-methyltransferase TrmK [Pseudomonas sp. S75]|uniref:tRNA (adenine(22)-N(1))-methyltransferase n=1 Tax=unclassified Pseudomonas TaxID=196821 RepID=UPI001907B023|nr:MULTISPECIES: tRNA (adenine(22)-N(1))-methyltransferase TrmK [unclassified Pseudomonas]MBJ9977679.1 tRNA (adenine(22)-N(1))-methyltransferase TrmK [Pseudomonas sp. S30]MBK0155051.1 tRNA (adenine(22)-N(1))-methyltransferase TrmK [Pseudomonas sp. S75]
MNEQTLSQRLEHVAAQVRPGARLADIGSDHGYLPVALALRGKLEAAVIGEVAVTPFESARRNVRRNYLSERITVRLADGLEAIEPSDRIDTVSLCGMGGETIVQILDRGVERLQGRPRLVLQPNGGEPALRRWLMEHGYRIVAEQVVRENRFDYEIIVAAPGEPAHYSGEELLFGPLLMREKSPAFLDKWQRMRRQRQMALANFARARDVPQAKAQLFAQHLDWIDRLLA